MSRYHLTIWKVGIAFSTVLKILGGKLLDAGWLLGDHVAIHHYMKTKEGIEMKKQMQREMPWEMP